MDIWFSRYDDPCFYIRDNICNMNNTDASYIAGLFDGEGSAQYKKVWEKKKNHNGKGYRKTHAWRINMEITMTDRSVLTWLLEVLGCGTLTKKPRSGYRKDGTKYLMQWRWRCTYRDAFHVCCILFPYAHTKLPKIQQIISHYCEKKLEEGNVIDLEHYKMWKKDKLQERR